MAIALAGCSSSKESGSSNGIGNTGTGGSSSCAASTEPYPAGPYGATVGSVFPALDWSGHVNLTAVGLATAQPNIDYSSDDVRKSCKSLALVHISEFV